MSIEQLVLQRLIEVRDGNRLEVGICGNVLSIFETCDLKYDQADELLDELILRWPERDESFIYPIGGQRQYHEERDAGTLWQNPRRLALLNWMIEELESVQAYTTV